jgi:uncharacterized membrane protein
MEKLIVVIGGLGLIIFVSFVLSWPVMALWNGCLVDAVTGVKEITWLQGWGISILCGFLFKTSVTSK